MAESISKTQRWIDLISYLAGRRFVVPVEELMERVPAYTHRWMAGGETDRASVRRTFERDKDELRELGIPLETASYRDEWGEEHQGYRLARRDFYLPYLRLLSGPQEEGAPEPPGPDRMTGVGEVELAWEEAGLALDALRRVAALPAFPFRREARSAFRKLAFDLEPERFDATPVLFLSEPPAGDLQADLRTLNDCLLARKRVRFTYHGIYREETTEREVAPYALVFHSGNWYLIGHDALRDGIRVFRVSRMERLSPNRSAPQTPDFEIPDDFRTEDHLTRDAWELGSPEEEPVTARVLFRFPLSVWAGRNERGELVEQRTDGSAVRAFRVRQVSPLLRWILSMEGEAEVLEPPELREGLREVARRVVALYEAGSSSSSDAGGAGPSETEADG